MPSHFPGSERDKISALNVVEAQFVKLHLPAGTLYLHSGCGEIIAEGQSWLGISDSVSGLIGAANVVREPRVGQASAAVLVLAGADINFMKTMRSIAPQLEGRRASIYYGVVDGETMKLVGSLIPMLIRGYMSAPSLRSKGIGTRTVTITVESIYSAKNFSLQEVWNGPGQRRRFAGDKGLDFAGMKIQEQIR